MLVIFNAKCKMINAKLPHFASLHSQGKFFNAECKVQNAKLPHFALLHSQGFFKYDSAKETKKAIKQSSQTRRKKHEYVR